VKSVEVFCGDPPLRLNWGRPSGASIIGAGATDAVSGADTELSLQPTNAIIVTSVLTVFQLVRRIRYIRSRRRCAETLFNCADEEPASL
jgi:hypothetical protein